MNEERLEKLFTKYPRLPNFIDAGIISLKSARRILGFEDDRDLMHSIFTELLDIGAVYGVTTVSWRPTEELKKYMQKRRESVDN